MPAKASNNSKQPTPFPLMRTVYQALLLTVPLTFSAATSELFEFNKMMLVYAFTIIIVTLWLLRMVQEQRFIWKKTTLGWFMLAFLASQFLATIFSIHPHTSWFGYYSRFHGGLLSTISYALLYFAAISNLRHEDWKPLIKTLIVSTLIVSLYSLPEKLGVSLSCVRFRGEWNTACWQEATNPRYRIFGTFGQPNWLAAYLVTLLPLSYWWLGAWWQQIVQKNMQRLQKTKLQPLTFSKSFSQFLHILSQHTSPFDILTHAAAITGTLSLIFTDSRSGWLAIVAAAGVFTAGLAKDWLTDSTDRLTALFKQSHWVTPAAVILFAAAFTFGTPFTPAFPQLIQEKITAFTSPLQPEDVAPRDEPTAQLDVSLPETPAGTALQTGGTESGVIRQIVWKGAIDIWKRYPLLGSGVETFAYSYYQSRPIEHNFVSEWDFLYNKAHNEFLNLLATTGLVGLGTYLAMLAASSWQLWTNRLRQPEDPYFSLALLAGSVALMVSNFFGFSTVAVGVLAFLWAGLDTITKNINAPPTPAYQWHHWKNLALPQKMAGAVIVTLGLLALNQVWFWWNNDKMLADAQVYAAAGHNAEAYQTLAILTTRSPHQAEYWEQRALLTAQLAVAVNATQDATRAAQLANDAVLSADLAVETNPVHLNMWKSRARAFIWLSALDEKYLYSAISALQTANQLAPTNPKILYNLALLYENTDQPELADATYQAAIDLKPDYDQARTSYAQWLVRQASPAAALEQYRYIDEVLKPGEDLHAGTIRALEATVAAQR